MDRQFARFARKAAIILGSPKAFVFVLFLYGAWAVSGFFFNFNNTWQLIANTSTTLATTLIVILNLNTQNVDTLAIHLKLNELIRVNEVARNAVIGLEECEGKEAEKLRDEFRQMKDD